MNGPGQHNPTSQSTRHSLDPETGRFERLSRRQFLLRNLALFGSVLVCDSVGETNLPQITHHQLSMPGLSTPTRVVQLSDLHRSQFVSEDYIARAVAHANALRPDLVLLTGDFVTHSSDYAASCAKCVAQLRAPLGVYGVLGNHDYWCDNYRGAPRIIRTMEAANVGLLINRNTRLPNGMYLIGIDDIAAGIPDLRMALEGIPLNAARFAMTHNPLLLNVMKPYDCVIVAGHTHGGQIVLPYITRSLFKYPYGLLSGWWSYPGFPCRMYVTRGVGVVNLPFRFGCPPEISVFDLVPA